MFGIAKRPTELVIRGSRAKNCAEYHGNVRFGVAPQKPTKNCKKPILKFNFLAIVKFGKKVDFFFGEARAAALASPRSGRSAAAPQPPRAAASAAAMPYRKKIDFLPTQTKMDDCQTMHFSIGFLQFLVGF